MGKQTNSSRNKLKPPSPTSSWTLARHFSYWHFGLWTAACNEQDGGCPCPHAPPRSTCFETSIYGNGCCWGKPSHIRWWFPKCCCCSAAYVLSLKQKVLMAACLYPVVGWSFFSSVWDLDLRFLDVCHLWARWDGYHPIQVYHVYQLIECIALLLIT